ncbi:hypothetical protein HW571_21765 [Agrobacterium genomosp. 3]|uniref:hypothetical protein n=1 Tax=Agrobacterium tomkonis TaxID=1183410 RepID=UPI001CD873A1|nr:hypothetical protein [Agrobacterium tomkonis]MCA1878707.1 hypothetical protein [Agrobacterium tumefaciens]MCA1893932.1 hypothetical protein [Agrobacterium tomkonis]
MRFLFPYSHAFPNGRVTVDDDDATEPGCLVEFSDGTTVFSAWRREKENIALDIPGYQTAKGTRVNARRWRLVRGSDGIWRTKRST